MQNNNRKIFDSLLSRTKVYIVLIFILLCVICILRPFMIIPSIILFIVILGYTYFANNKRKSEISQHLQDLTLNVNATAKNSLIHSPFPLIIIETDEPERDINRINNMNINYKIYDLRKYGRVSLIFLK